MNRDDKVVIAYLIFAAVVVVCLTAVDVVKELRKEPANAVPINAPAE